MELHCRIASQRLELWESAELLAGYTVSTSLHGTGQEEGSYQTPLGGHRVCAWIGGGEAPGTVFESREATGEVLGPDHWQGGDERDRILSRILWLDGIEARNRNSRERYIYIHGTNHEELLGTPASQGCIRMANADVIELFERTEGQELLVFIHEGASST